MHSSPVSPWSDCRLPLINNIILSNITWQVIWIPCKYTEYALHTITLYLYHGNQVCYYNCYSIVYTSLVLSWLCIILFIYEFWYWGNRSMMVNHMHIWNSTTVSHHLLATICELHMLAHCEIRQMLCMTVTYIKFGKLDACWTIIMS